MTEDIFRQLQQNSASMAFRNPLFDEFNLKEALAASVEILRRAQAECLEREIKAAEIAPAIKFLSTRSDKTKLHCERFQAALLEPDQTIRYGATSQALALIDRQRR